MILADCCATTPRYDGGDVCHHLAGTSGRLWSLSVIAGADAVITWFGGLTTTMRTTGVGA